MGGALTEPLTEIRQLAKGKSPIGEKRTQEVLDTFFRRIPLRTQYALTRWPLGQSRVLDVGCAYGTSLAHFGPGSVGLDNNPEAVAFCGALNLDCRLVDVDKDTVPVEQGSFDFLWVSDILEHLEAPRVLLRQLAPTLAPGGKLLLQSSVLPESAPARWLSRRIRGMAPFDAEVHYHQWTVPTLSHLVNRAGFRVVDVAVPAPPSWARAAVVLRPRLAGRVILVGERDEAIEATVARSEARNQAQDLGMRGALPDAD